MGMAESESGESLIVSPGSSEQSVRAAGGWELSVPDGWELLPPGDAALTRRVKAGGPTWTVQEKKGRRTFSKGVWAPADRIAAVRADLEVERSTESYAKKRLADAKRRERKQGEYVEDFQQAVLSFLNFSSRHADLAASLAQAVASHATPVAWLRHQTTAYDNMKIARIKGKRREVRRMLAEESRRLLAGYRGDGAVDAARCPLQTALRSAATSKAATGKTLTDD